MNPNHLFWESHLLESLGGRILSRCEELQAAGVSLFPAACAPSPSVCLGVYFCDDKWKQSLFLIQKAFHAFNLSCGSSSLCSPAARSHLGPQWAVPFPCPLSHLERSHKGPALAAASET